MPSIAWLAACNQVFPLAGLSNLNGWNYPPTPWPGRRLGPPLVLAFPDLCPDLLPLPHSIPLAIPAAPRHHLYCTAPKLPDTRRPGPTEPSKLSAAARLALIYRLQLAIPANASIVAPRGSASGLDIGCSLPSLQTLRGSTSILYRSETAGHTPPWADRTLQTLRIAPRQRVWPWYIGCSLTSLQTLRGTTYCTAPKLPDTRRPGPTEPSKPSAAAHLALI